MQIVIVLVSLVVVPTAAILGLVFGLRVARQLPSKSLFRFYTTPSDFVEGEASNTSLKWWLVYACVLIAVLAAVALLLVVFAPFVT